jgi:hypothetical protein
MCRMLARHLKKETELVQKEFSTCYVCYTFVNVKLNGFLKFARTFKIRGFDICSRRKSQGGGCRVSYGCPLKRPVARVVRGLHIRSPKKLASFVRTN